MPSVHRDNVRLKATPNAADLPPKVLEAIFEILRDAHHCTDTRDHGFLSSWIPTTWVCGRWRAVALAAPQLWSWIDITGRHCDPDAVATLLARSGDEDLSVSLDGQAMDMTSGCAMVLAVAHRISHLSVCMNDAQAPLVQELLRHVGEKLGTLQLYCVDESQGNDITLDVAQIPNLRTLSIRNIFLHPTAELVGLTDLTLQRMWNVNGLMGVGEYVYGMLAACPDLESLDIEDALPQAALVEASAFQKVVFKKLHSLWVNELAMDLPANLANFVVAPSTSIHITARYDGCLPESFETATVTGEEDLDEQEEADGTVLPLAVLPASKFDNFPPLEATRDLSLRLGTPCCIGDIHVEGGNWQVTIPTLDDNKAQTNRLPELVEHVFTEFPTAFVDPSKIVYLEVHVAQQVPEYGAWAELLVEFPNVVGLAIGGRSAFNDVVVALKGKGKASGSGKLLPKLAQLTACVAVPKGALIQDDARAFGALLAERAQRGNMLESLIVKVPELKLNKAMVHLASALVAYMAVRGAKGRVVRQNCLTCHDIQVHHHACKP